MSASTTTARKFVPSPEQAAYFDWVERGTGNAILSAVAGAGKTTTILEGCARMAGRVWMGVYNKKMADEIKAKVARHPALSERKGLYVSTFHSAGFSALRFAFSKNFALRTDANKVRDIARRIAGDTRRAEWLSGVCEFVSMAKNRGLGVLEGRDFDNWVNMADHFDLGKSLPDDLDWNDLVKFCNEVLDASNADLDTIDFDDMVYLPLQRGLRLLQHEWVLVDEAQDSNPTRRALAIKLLAPGGRFVAVGDPHQAIFGFTGADNDALQQIAATMRAKVMPLSVTYRCPKAVVAVARTVVSHITAHESAPAGLYRNIDAVDLMPEICALERREYGRTAILCRFNAPLVSLCFAMIRKDIPAKIEGREVGEGLVKLARRWKVKSLVALADKLRTYEEREVAKAIKKDNQARAAQIEDECATMRVLIENTTGKGGSTVEELVVVINGLFSDDVAGSGVVTLCSAHKSKGLEWPRVMIYGRNKYMPCAWAVRPWQKEQEDNLIYVALTRAMEELVDVSIRNES